LGHDEFGVDARNAYFKSSQSGKITQIAHGDQPAPVREKFAQQAAAK
jgi:hypothetical protein